MRCDMAMQMKLLYQGYVCLFQFFRRCTRECEYDTTRAYTAGFNDSHPPLARSPQAHAHTGQSCCGCWLHEGGGGRGGGGRLGMARGGRCPLGICLKPRSRKIKELSHVKTGTAPHHHRCR
jgi:hypothetical protein